MIFVSIFTIAKFPLELKEEQKNNIYLNNIFQNGIKRIDFAYFMTPFGISYDYLDKEEKEVFKKLFISYENIKKFIINYQK